MSRAVNELTYMFPLASLKYPDRAFCRAIYRSALPLAPSQRDQVRRICEEVVADAEGFIDLRWRLGMPMRRTP